MRFLALVVALFIIAVGIAGLITPDALIAVGRYAVTPAGLYAVAALRVAIGLVLVLAAPLSAAPKTLRVLGAFVVVAGLATPFFGAERAQTVFAWALTRGTALIRVAAVVILAAGGFIVFAFASGRRRG